MTAAEANDALEESTPSTARRGPGRLQWSGGGWFGALFGGSSWLLLTPSLLVGKSAALASIWGACGFITIGVGLVLWKKRDVLLPYFAIMILLLTQWLAACVAVVSLVVLAPRTDNPFEAHTATMFACLLCFPALMIQMTLIERSAK